MIEYCALGKRSGGLFFALTIQQLPQWDVYCSTAVLSTERIYEIGPDVQSPKPAHDLLKKCEYRSAGPLSSSRYHGADPARQIWCTNPVDQLERDRNECSEFESAVSENATEAHPASTVAHSSAFAYIPVRQHHPVAGSEQNTFTTAEIRRTSARKNASRTQD